MSSVRSYFDLNAHNHVYHNDPHVYQTIISQILQVSNKKKFNILDVGCGDGSFLRGLKDRGIEGEFYGIDLSYSMLKTASNNIKDIDAKLFVADGFQLPIVENAKFDLIHIDSVLHHLIGKTRSGSINLTANMIHILVNRLNRNGIIVIEEKYYDSYLFKTFTAACIFYMLKFLTISRLDISKIVKEFSKGLEVSFLHELELIQILRKYGIPQLINRNKVKVPFSYKLLLLRDYGHISFMLTKKEQ